MAQKEFKQNFAADYGGINGECSALEPDTGDVNRAVNLEYAVGNSLRGRLGCQIAGDTGDFFAVFPYTYTRTQDQYDLVYVDAGALNTLTTTKTAADGATIQKLIGINKQMWVLDTFNYVVTYVSGSYPFTWYTYVNGSNINFVIKANGASILDTSLGNGLTSSTSVWSLLNTIDGLAQLSISRTTRGTCPPFAIVNGNQTTALSGTFYNYGTAYTATVDNTPHNFYPGDIITFPNLVAGYVVARTNTTITYVGPQVTLVDDQVLGYMQQAATGFPISTASSASSGNLTISIPYWRNILASDALAQPSVANPLYDQFNNVFQSGSATWSARAANTFYAPAVSTNADGCLYIASSGKASDGVTGIHNNLVKTDGQAVYRAGMPGKSENTFPLGVTGPYITSTATAGGTLTGNYKYKAFLRRVDAQGNIIDGPTGNIYSVTYGALGEYGVIGVGGAIYNDASGWQSRSCYKYTAESTGPAAFFQVDDNSAAPGLPAFLQVGDPVCFLDDTTPSAGLLLFTVGVVSVGVLHRAIVTDYKALVAPSSIKVSGSTAYNIPDNSPISTGLTMVILRTTAGGNQYYVLCEVPFTGYAAFQCRDSVLDAVLVTHEQYTEPILGKEHNAPPPCSLVCQHQGGLVVARGTNAPNTVGFSTADGIEYFPTASNSFDIPSNQSGYITAIASDTINRLAVFKDRAYYDIVGDLDAANFSVNVKNEGDYGISSQAALVRIGDTLVGPCKAGFILVQDGTLNSQSYRKLSTRIIGQQYNFAWATASNDPLYRRYICSIPTSSEPVNLIIDYSREVAHTFEQSFTTKIDPVGGKVVLGDYFYWLSQTSPYAVFRRLYRFNGDSPSGNGNGDSFIDNTNAISYILESQPINLDEPDVLKTAIRARIWSMPNDYVAEGWVPFSTLVEGGISPLATYVGSANPGGTSSTITFSTANNIFKDVKLVGMKAHFYILRLTTNAIRTAPFITGYDILYAENYDPEDLVK